MILRVAALLALCVLMSAIDAIAQHVEAPDAQHPPHPRCFFPIVAGLDQSSEKSRAQLAALLNEYCGPSEPGGRPIKHRNRLSRDGHFRIHYDTSGSHAVAPRDINANGVPDYIDSVDYYLEVAWRVEIDELGYAPPPSDRRGLGPEIDVYICGLPEQLYGGAWTENDNILGQDPVRVHGYLVLDNDYAGYPTPGILGLRVTTAHEFHHIVQFSAYRTALAPLENLSQYSLYEATATWMEEVVHPGVDDWRQYAESLLSRPQDYGFATHRSNVDLTTGYGHILYMMYLERRFGIDVVRHIWEEFRTRESFDAIDVVLRREDFNLSRSYCQFAQWSYYTGARARDSSMLPAARRLPTMSAALTRTLAQGEASFEGELYPLSFGLYRLLAPTANVNIRDTIDLLVTNARGNLGAGGPQLDKEGFRIEVTSSPRADFLTLERDAGTLYYRLVPLGGSSNEFCLDAIFGDINQVIAARTSPQPFINMPGEQMLFAVGGTSEEIRRVRIWIYSSAMTRVAEIDQSGLAGRDNQLGVLWNGEDHTGNPVPSGVYIYEMSVNGGAPVLGKFAVVRE